jgi:Skp family chaperone for outer membrane proteins
MNDRCCAESGADAYLGDRLSVSIKKGVLVMTKMMAAILTVVLLIAYSGHASETVKGAQKDFESFKSEMSAQLDSVDHELADLRAKMKEKGSAAQDNSVKELEQTRARLNKELSEMESKSHQSWKDFKKGFAKSVENLNSKVQKALKD